MPDRFIESHIKQLPLFQNLSEPQLDLIVQAFQVLRFQSGETVIKQGNATQGLFVIVEGAGILTQKNPDGTERRIKKLKENEVLDGGALFETTIELYSLRITEPSIILFLSHARMSKALSYYPEIRQNLGTSDIGTTAPAKKAVRARAVHQDEAISSLHRNNEKTLLTRRRHPWAFVRRGWLAVIILVMFLAAGLLAFTVQRLLGLSLMGLGFVLFGLMMTYFYFEWRNDSFIITDQRVIRIERVIPTFSVRINEIPLDSIQAVETSLPEGDLFARIFDYGDIELRNASDGGDLILDMIPQPEDVQKMIFAERQHATEGDEQIRRNAIRAEIEKNLNLNNQENQAAGAANIEQSRMRTETWNSFSPARMQFTDKDGNTVIRKHITVWLQAIFGPSVMIFGALLILVITIFSGNNVMIFGIPLTYLGIPLTLLFLVAGGFWFWWSDWDWRNDMYVISDGQVTLTHKRPLWLQNEVDQILLNRVDNVVSETKGLMDTIFQRGDVKISLIGEGLENAKVFSNVFHPHEIQAELSRRQARAKEAAANADALRRQQEITDYLSVYHETIEDVNQKQATGTYPEVPPTRTGQTQPYTAQDRERPPNVPRLTRQDSQQKNVPPPPPPPRRPQQ